MLVQEVSVGFGLVFVELATELYVSLGLGQVSIELSYPFRVIPVQIFIKFVQHAKVRTRRTPNHQ